MFTGCFVGPDSISDKTYRLNPSSAARFNEILAAIFEFGRLLCKASNNQKYFEDNMIGILSADALVPIGGRTSSDIMFINEIYGTGT